jgi:hypothetical protein
MFLVVAVILTPHLGARAHASGVSVKVKVDVEVCGTLTVTEKEVTISVEEAEDNPAHVSKGKKKRKWVLDLGTVKALREKAKGLHGKAVVVKGKAVLLGVTTQTFQYKGGIPAFYTNPPLKAPDLVGTRTTLDLERRVEVTSLAAAPGK